MASQNEDMLERELNNIRSSFAKIAPFFSDPLLTDIFVSSNGDISIKRFGKDIADSNIKLNVNERLRIMNFIAKYHAMNINIDEYPVLEATVPIPEYSGRITGIYPPFSDAPNFTIRRPPSLIHSLETYKEKEQLTSEWYDIIVSYIKDKKNIIVSGGTGTGKTTFINAIIKKKSEIYPRSRFYIVQDINELQCNAKYVVWVFVRAEQAVKAVQLALRQSPDSIIFGEVRNGYVMADLLDAWNTGHPGGITSIHANTTRSTFTRIRTLLYQVYDKGKIPNVTELIDLVVHLSRSPKTGVFVDDVLETIKIRKKEKS
jgi:type IV secretion system protein VirB11